MVRLSDIVTVSLGAAALLTLVYVKDRPTPTPGVRTAVELIGNKTQWSVASQRTAAGSPLGLGSRRSCSVDRRSALKGECDWAY
jgi:hypothetical protein